MKKLLAVGLIAAFALLSACSTGTDSGNGYQVIDAKKAKQMMDQSQSYVIVDVRTQAEYATGHIANAVLIPVDQVAQLAPDQLTDKQQLIFVYCRTGARAAQGSAMLVQLGYTNVYDIGGIVNWPYGTVTS